MAAAAALALIAAGGSLYSQLSGSGSSGSVAKPWTPPTPKAPDPAVASAEQQAALTRQKQGAAGPATPSGRAATLLTGPSGLDAPATTRKTLLGQ